MKKLCFLLLVFASCNLSTNGNEIDSGLNYAMTVSQLPADPILENIQTKIYQAFVTAIMSSETKNLEEISGELQNLYEKNPQNLVQYWRAYAAYYTSIFYTTQKKPEDSKKHIERGIDLMKKLKNKNTEDYALLALMQSFSIQFKSGIGAGMMSSKVNKNAQKSKDLDGENPRAYFVLGSSDYYTPEQYGGGKKAEEYLLKAITLPAQKTANHYLPSWGVEESYEMLIKLYIKKEDWANAKNHFAKAKELFPQSYNINSLASNLVGK